MSEEAGLEAEGRRLLSRATRIREGWKLRASKMDGGDRYDLIGDPCGFPVATFGDPCDVEFYEWAYSNAAALFDQLDAANALLRRCGETLKFGQVAINAAYRQAIAEERNDFTGEAKHSKGRVDRFRTSASDLSDEISTYLKDGA